MIQKILAIWFIAGSLFVGCASNPPANQKISKDSPAILKNARVPTNILETTHICADEANTAFEVGFQKLTDEASTVEFKNAKLLASDTTLQDQTYPVKYQVQTSSSGDSSLKFATYNPTNRTSDSFFLQIATRRMEEVSNIKPGKLSVRNPIGRTKNTSLICCSDKLKPTKNDGLWSCQ